MAASKCPKCSHEIEVRDGFGEMLPLAHCSSCDSFYPEKLGSCRWCGTTPQRAPVGPFVWKGVGIATFVAMAWGAWLVHDDPPAEVSNARLAAVLKPDSSAGSLDSSLLLASMPADSSVADSSASVDSTVVVASDSTIQSVAEVVAAISDSIGQPSATTIAVADSPSVIVEPVAQPQPVTRAENTPRETEVYRDPRVTRDAAPREPRIVSEKDVAAVPETASAPDPRSLEPATRAAAPTPPPAKARTTKSSSRTLARAEETAPSRTPARSSTTKPVPRSTAASKLPAKTAVKAPAKVPAKVPAKASVAKATVPKSTGATRTTVAKAPAAKTTPSARTTRVVWVNSVARNWVVVRASANRGGRVIASIGPNTRVQLGETRGGWRRIRAKGLAGWVDQRAFFAGAGSRKTGSLAVR